MTAQGHGLLLCGILVPVPLLMILSEETKWKYQERRNLLRRSVSRDREASQGGVRPVLVLQNDVGNRFSSTTIVAAITSIQKKIRQPTHIILDYDFLECASTVLLEQLRTIDKQRLTDYLGSVDDEDMERIEAAMSVSLGFGGICCG